MVEWVTGAAELDRFGPSRTVSAVRRRSISASLSALRADGLGAAASGALTADTDEGFASSLGAPRSAAGGVLTSGAELFASAGGELGAAGCTGTGAGMPMSVACLVRALCILSSLPGGESPAGLRTCGGRELEGRGIGVGRDAALCETGGVLGALGDALGEALGCRGGSLRGRGAVLLVGRGGVLAGRVEDAGGGAFEADFAGSGAAAATSAAGFAASAGTLVAVAFGAGCSSSPLPQPSSRSSA